MKIKAGLVAGLTIGEAGKLFGITKNKLYLKPGFVVEIQGFGIKVGVG